ncbi:MAG: flagellar protein FlaG [Deltaproteobacteria bacterium]|nr:flagellar protein FlaG [Deltaproteobacteria bacterium]
MKVDGINAFDSFSSSQKTFSAVEEVERNQKLSDSVQDSEKAAKKQPTEEILSRIKKITEDGTYSIRFEKDKDTETMVVRLVDQETGEVKRQFPPEELLEVSQRLDEWRGNIVDTES